MKSSSTELKEISESKLKNRVVSETISIQPMSDAEDIIYNQDAIRALLGTVEYDKDFTTQEMMEEFLQYPHRLNLVWVGDEVAAGFIIDYEPMTAYLHGAILPKYERTGLSFHVVPAILHNIFNVNGKDKVITKVPLDLPGPRGFVIGWGFTRINRERGNIGVYRLRKSEYLVKSETREIKSSYKRVS